MVALEILINSVTAQTYPRELESTETLKVGKKYQITLTPLYLKTNFVLHSIKLYRKFITEELPTWMIVN